MNKIYEKFGPLANFEFDKLILGQLFSHFSDAIIQFLLINNIDGFIMAIIIPLKKRIHIIKRNLLHRNL